jgi:hypothetical protein
MSVGQMIFNLFDPGIYLHGDPFCGKGNSHTEDCAESREKDKGPLDKGNDVDLLLSLTPPPTPA